jgi:hypothetical protein
MTKNIFVVPIEPLTTRYTQQWYEHIPNTIDIEAKRRGQDINIVVVEGEQVPPVPTPGAFLDFGATNIYKSSQLGAIATEFQHGRVKPGDRFLFTDAWNPMAISVKYMSELLNIPIRMHGMWHAGSYDPADFLGRLIGNKPWVRHAEKSMLYSYDTNWFATSFHMDMFIKNLFGPFYNEGFEPTYVEVRSELIGSRRVDLTGWPMDYLFNVLEPYSKLEKKQRITFPHRIAPEKQIEIFKDLAASMPEYEWVVCQEREMTKHEYHTVLGESSIVFSANLQETFGISMIEGLICGSFPMVPNRLSYVEMYDPEFKYPSDWTESWDQYLAHKPLLIDRIKLVMGLQANDQRYIKNLMESQLAMMDRYVHATPLINALLS